MNTKTATSSPLTKSKIYQDFEKAFSETTQLPVSLRPIESWQLPHNGKRTQNTFCCLMSEKSRSCSACLQTQQRLTQLAQHEPHTVTCALGLSDTAVPVTMGDRPAGFLLTGQ